MEQEVILQQVAQKIRALFAEDFSGHDVWHSLRVEHTAATLADAEGCDAFVVRLGALLHDADDPKLFSTKDFANARAIMAEASVPADTAERVIAAIATVSFKGTDTKVPDTLEGKVLQDADRLDAIGAIGAARAFAYGGSHNRPMYDPDVPPSLNMDEAAYRKNRGSSLNHFYEKLFLLKDMMNTPSARRMAEERDAFLHAFAEEFLAEWEGKR